MKVHEDILVPEVNILSIRVESSKIPGCLIRHKPSYIWDKVNSFDIEGVTLEVIHTKDTKVSADELLVGLIKVFKVNVKIFVIDSIICTFQIKFDVFLRGACNSASIIVAGLELYLNILIKIRFESSMDD